MIELPRLYAIGKQLVYGLAKPVNQSMYDAVCSFIGELWGQAGYGVLYENIIVQPMDKGGVTCHLEDPEAVYNKIVDLFRFKQQT